jgi:hypothetical protein
MALIFLIRIWILIGINFQIDLSKIGYYFIICITYVNFFYKKLKLFKTGIFPAEINFATHPVRSIYAAIAPSSKYFSCDSMANGIR